MNADEKNSKKQAALAVISKIHAVEGFDPTPLAVEYTDLNGGETRLRLPVMAQIAWFRLAYPEGRIAISVVPGKDCFVATARIYLHYTDPAEQYISEATASRGYLAEKPTVSPREWAQTAAVGIALRNAGFGLQFGAAGDGFDAPAVDELGGIVWTGDPVGELPAVETQQGQPPATASVATPAEAEPEEMTFEQALNHPCPISKYKGKTLGEVLKIDPKALVWVANKFTGDETTAAAAKLICEKAAEQIA